MSAGVVFVVMKSSINFSYYFFSMIRVHQRNSHSDFLDKTQSADKRFKFKTLVKLIYAIFLTPLFITFLFVHDLSGSMVC